MTEIIKVESKEKSTTIRVKESTKKMLESLAVGKETHEHIILRLGKIAKTMSTEYGSKVVESKNVIGTQYERIHKVVNIEIMGHHYSVVCVYNDLKLFALFRINKQLANYSPNKELPKEWEVELEIVNIKKDDGQWQSPPTNLTTESSRQYYNSPEYLFLYTVSLKNILEETFDIKLYGLAKEEDYLDLHKWEEAYKVNNLSTESYDYDVNRKLRELTI